MKEDTVEGSNNEKNSFEGDPPKFVQKRDITPKKSTRTKLSSIIRLKRVQVKKQTGFSFIKLEDIEGLD